MSTNRWMRRPGTGVSGAPMTGQGGRGVPSATRTTRLVAGAVALTFTLGACSGAGSEKKAETKTTGASGASGVSGSSGASGASGEEASPAATATGGGTIDGAALAKAHKSAIFAVLTRDCEGQAPRIATAFAIDARHLATTWNAVAANATASTSSTDPQPWIRSSDRVWRRATVTSASADTGIAILTVDKGFPDLPQKLTLATRPLALSGRAVALGFPAVTDGDLASLAVTATERATAAPPNIGFGFTYPAAGLASAGLNGAPLLNPAGEVVGVQATVATKGETGGSPHLSDLKAGIETALASPVKTSVSCAADSDRRAVLAWGALLGKTGGAARASELSAVAGMEGVARVGSVAAEYGPYLPKGAAGAVVLGPFDSQKAATEGRQKAIELIKKAGKKVDESAASVDLMPLAAFPADKIPPSFTTMTLPPPTTAPPTTLPPSTTARPRTTTATTAKSGSSGAKGCSGGSRTLRKIVGGGSGMSVIFYAGPSTSSGGVAKAANGYQVSVVNGSSTNGFSQIVLPGGKSCPWVQNKYLG